MYEFYGFDPKTLTDDELFEKQLALTSKRLMAARFGKVDAANQLQMMITAIELERRERMFNAHIGVMVRASSPVVVETDVDLQPAVEETANKKSAPDHRPLRRAVRTSKPVISE
jgi:hypothetical protein